MPSANTATAPNTTATRSMVISRCGPRRAGTRVGASFWAGTGNSALRA